MADYRTLLEHDLERVARPAGFTFDDLARRRDRKRQRQRISAGVVGFAVFAAAIWLVTSAGPTDRTQTFVVPGGGNPGPTVNEAPSATGRVGFIGLPPAGATPSTPERGELVLGFYGGTTKGPAGRTRLRVYADGRVIWQRDANLPYGANLSSTGFLEQRLTPEGVELLRSEALSTGLFDRDLDRDLYTYLDIACYNAIRVPHGERLVQITYRRFSCAIDGTPPPMSTPATSEESQSLRLLDDRLSDPASWLPASAWEDPAIRPYVPSRFAVCAWRQSPDRIFSVLPPAAADLLRGDAGAPEAGWDPRTYCFEGLTTDTARALARSIEAAGIRPHADIDALIYVIPDPVDRVLGVEDVILTFEPNMPDGEHDCGCGG